MHDLVSLAAVTKYHRLGGLNNKHLFLTALEAGRSGCQHGGILGEGSLPGYVLTWPVLGVYMQGEREISCLLFFLQGH